MSMMMLPDEYIGMNDHELQYQGGTEREGIGLTQAGGFCTILSQTAFGLSYKEYKDACEQARGGRYADVIEAQYDRIPQQKAVMTCSQICTLLSIGMTVWGIVELADSRIIK